MLLSLLRRVEHSKSLAGASHSVNKYGRVKTRQNIGDGIEHSCFKYLRVGGCRFEDFLVWENFVVLDCEVSRYNLNFFFAEDLDALRSRSKLELGFEPEINLKVFLKGVICVLFQRDSFARYGLSRLLVIIFSLSVHLNKTLLLITVNSYLPQSFNISCFIFSIIF